MGLLTEVFSQMLDDARQFLGGALRVAVFTALVFFQLRWLDPDGGVGRLVLVTALAGAGAAAWFLGPFHQPKDRWVGHGKHWLWMEQAAPISGSTLLAWGLWVAAVACAVMMD